jgi:hypothetical protein
MDMAMQHGPGHNTWTLTCIMVIEDMNKRMNMDMGMNMQHENGHEAWK